MKIKNASGEAVDIVVEGNLNASITIVFVHGFGTDKDEGGLFVEISNSLKTQYRIARFDFTGYEKSEGKQEEVNLNKEDAYDKWSSKCIRIKGNHAFTDPGERKELVSQITRIFHNNEK